MCSQAAGDAGNTIAALNYAHALRTGEGIAKDTKAAFQQYKTLADKRLGGATYSLAIMYRIGCGCEKDTDKALQLFTKLAEQGVVPAMHQLATLLVDPQRHSSVSAAENERLAAQWLTKGAAAGDPLSALSLAIYTATGTGGVKQDNTEAFRLHSIAAQHGLPRAQYNLGCHYFSGQGTQQDLSLAAQHWQAASEKGIVMATMNLAKMYAQGLGVQQDQQRALELYAAAVGSDASMSADKVKTALALLMSKVQTQHDTS